jgi:UDP-3-O-[3-hydroxymyristoyl] glucosamine N-acyltransferase
MEFLLTEIAELIHGKIKGDASKRISGVAPFDTATEGEVTFAGTARYLSKIDRTKAGAVIVPADFVDTSKTLVLTDNPQVAFAKVVSLFHPISKPKTGISPHAFIGDNFTCGKDVTINPYAVVQNRVTMGNRVTVHSNVVIGDQVVIGDDVMIYPNVSILERCVIGNRVTIHAGSVIGSDGFGFAPDGETYFKIPQTGIVQIDDDVEIGAGNTIDRATFGKTWIKQGVKTDNLVHVAHNVTVGENTLLVAQVGISGSVTIGKHAILAGQAGVSGHLTIGDGAIVGPKGGISKSVPDGEIVSGAPEMPHKLWLRVQSVIPRLPELKKKLSEVEKRLQKIEEKFS